MPKMTAPGWLGSNKDWFDDVRTALPRGAGNMELHFPVEGEHQQPAAGGYLRRGI
jgi:hypothetical protein